ncbi:MAG: redox-sensitive transcriptional activator SoxR [Rhodobacteraceae bacterium]|nr:redox-sensitive transcriptional activator SoxR [Paracoccaceae bacterium]
MHQKLRCFDRIRRVSFIKTAQTFRFTLPRIKELFSFLPAQRTPTAEDWRKISDIFKNDLNEKIDQLMRLRDALDGCIGCGCLSLRACQIFNPDDIAARHGTGARFIAGNP